MKIKTLLISGLLIILNLLQLKGQEFSITLGTRRAGTESFTTEVPLMVMDPDSIGISTRELSIRFPKAGIIPEEIKINYPNMKGAIDTVAILWYLKPENYTAKGEVNIILVTIGADSVKTFYIDNDNNRTFADNEEKFVFDKEIEKRDLEIKILGNYNKYTLMNPDYISPFSGPSRIKEYAKTWRNSNKKPSINLDLSIITGGGAAELIVTHQADAYQSYYKYRFQATNHGSLKPGAGIDFSWYNFHIIISGAYERLQFDEIMRTRYNKPDYDGGRPTYNRNNWPIQMLHGGISLEYDFRIDKFYIGPVASYYVTKSLDNRTFDFGFDDAKLGNWKAMEIGGKFKVPIGFKTMLYLQYIYCKTTFDASDFYDYFNSNIVYQPEYKKFNQNYFGFGFQFRLLGK
jgi:hypothetical protein